MQDSVESKAVLDTLNASPAFAGEVRADRLSRALYATDASLYQIVPDAVVLPRRPSDVAETVRACGRFGIPLTARGAGTGLTGGAVNRGIQLDCSRHLIRILNIDVDQRTAQVEPGVVLDELNAALAPHGLHFAPDVATSSRATIGGMIANNSCGAHSILYGRTVDHVLALDVVLSDGSTCTWGRNAGTSNNPLAQQCEHVLAEVARENAAEITARFPKILRSNGGYALDRLRIEDDQCINPETILSGSEGTLAIVVGATLRLTQLPKRRGLLVAHFDDLLESLAAIPAILEHRPAAIELLDRLVLDAALSQPAMARRASMIEGTPAALLVIELFDDNADALSKRLSEIADDLRDRRMGTAWPILTDPKQQEDIWAIRRSGLGLLMSQPGDKQPYAFVEDTAVDPSRLRDYIKRFAVILKEEGIEQAGYYAHASVGCLHVRPVINLRNTSGVGRMRRIADRISSLALEFGGTMTGEHGDGIVRSEWLDKMYGPRIIQAFGRIKQTFDPAGLFNPGKIVSPMPMTEHLRYASLPTASPGEDAESTTLDFNAHGGMLGLANMCSGVGQCRQRLVGTMCPSYMATGDERHTTRGRANALRLALSNTELIDGLSDPVLDEVMDLCLSCKACKTECPTGVDMARLKAEWLHQRHASRGVPLRSRLVAGLPAMAAAGSIAPRLANAWTQSRLMRALGERLFGLDRRMEPPRLASSTFRHWFTSSRTHTGISEGDAGPDERPPVVYFVDTWTNFFTPEVGIATVRVLEALGHRVIVPPTVCCGRPAISQGLLDKAARLAKANVSILSEYAESGVPIVGTEPSCLLTLTDEMPQLVRTAEARRIAEQAVTIETFIAKTLRAGAEGLSPRGHTANRDAQNRAQSPDPAPSSVLYHGHCHQKALVGTEDAMALLQWATAGRAEEINSGCCGMAGAFGHEQEHYNVARAIGEQRLFPVVRDRSEAEIVISGFSCRHQIEHHTGARPRHVIEVIAGALPEPQ